MFVYKEKKWTTKDRYGAKIVIVDFTLSSLPSFRNGYLIIPSSKEVFKQHVLLIEELDSLDVHGGVTYLAKEKNKLIIGFDTAHYGDYKLSREYIIKNINLMLKQIREIENRLSIISDRKFKIRRFKIFKNR